MYTHIDVYMCIHVCVYIYIYACLKTPADPRII